jgi:hypothetical protein
MPVVSKITKLSLKTLPRIPIVRQNYQLQLQVGKTHDHCITQLSSKVTISENIGNCHIYYVFYNYIHTSFLSFFWLLVRVHKQVN